MLLLLDFLAGAPFSSEVLPTICCCLICCKIPYSGVVNLICGFQKSPFHLLFACLLSVSTVLSILQLPFWASTSIYYTPRHSCCAHLPLFAAAPSCDQSDPTMPYVDTSTLTVADELKKGRKKVVSAFLHTVRPAVCKEATWMHFL